MMQASLDSIVVAGLELSSHIGVPEAERMEAQRLTVHIELVPVRPLSNLRDDIDNTVDYFVLTRRVRQLAGARPRQLIETLAEEICACVLAEFAVREIAVELRKYILPDTEYVAIRLRRNREA